MKLIVWKKQEFEELWKRSDCENEVQAVEVIKAQMKTEGEIELTRPLVYGFAVNISEPKEEKPPPAPAPAPAPRKPEQEESVEPEKGRPTKNKSS